LCVKDQNRSEGFGSHLLNFAKKLGSDNGFDYMFASIDLDGNEDRRIAFYKKNQFYKYIPSNIDFYEGPPLDPTELGTTDKYVSYISERDHVDDIDTPDTKQGAMLIQYIQYDRSKYPDYNILFDRVSRLMKKNNKFLNMYMDLNIVISSVPGIIACFKGKKLIASLFIVDILNKPGAIEWWNVKTPESIDKTYIDKTYIDKTYFYIDAFVIDKHHYTPDIACELLNKAKELGKYYGFKQIIAKVENKKDALYKLYIDNNFNRATPKEMKEIYNNHNQLFKNYQDYPNGSLHFYLTLKHNIE
jgi:ribosomal protein S18 acetylase RimI-like enzyme